MVVLMVTACGSPVVQASATTCTDGGDPLVCAAQQPWSPVATMLDGGVSRAPATAQCQKDKDCPAHHECKQGVCKSKGDGRHDDDDDDDDDDCDD